MEKHDQNEIRELLDRIARINTSQDWAGDINPSQRAALSYLARANRFSRAPSQVATYLSATRGTISQTLKALARKNLIVEHRSQADKRSISYEITAKGSATLMSYSADGGMANLLSKSDRVDMAVCLKKLIRSMLKARGWRSFGVCQTCHFHNKNAAGAYCSLLNEALTANDAQHICYEHKGI